MEKITRTKLALIGLPGSGKTTVAVQAAERYGANVIDTDALFEGEFGSIADYFSRRGEAEFRLKERQIVIQAAQEDCDIIACGGGVVCDRAAMNALRAVCDIVWLTAPVEVLRSRIENSNRPLKAELDRLAEQRTPLYAAYADHTVSTDTDDALAAVMSAVKKPRKNRYDILLCDADDTVLDFDRAMRYSILTAARAVGLRAPDDDIVNAYRAVNDALWLRLEKGEISRAELDATRFTAFAESMGAALDTAALSAAYLNAMRSTRFTLNGAIEFLTAVRERGIKVYIVTNSFVRFAEERLKAVAAVVDGAFISESVGYTKPDRRFFDSVLGALGVSDRSRVLVFGDSESSDIAGGRNSGIDTCLFDPKGTKTGTADYTVRSYVQALKIV